MAQRGRPRKNGFQDPWMLHRVMIVQETFNRVQEKEKYEVALLAAVDAVNEHYPNRPIGPRTVKGIRAEWQPEEATTALLVSKLSDAELQSPEAQFSLNILRNLGFPLTDKLEVYSLRVGDRPKHHR